MSTVEPTIELLDPATLLVDVNIRAARIDKDFTASIRDHGVIEPIVAVRTADGQVRVRHGHRRTLAAIETGRTTVPVVITGTEDDDTAGRIARQWHENQHRAALSNTEQVAVVDQLSLLGLSATAIARRLRTPRKHVDAALTVKDSELAAAAAARYAHLTLEQSAVIADYDDDPETVTALIAAAKLGPVQFARTVQKAATDRADQHAHDQLHAQLTDAGITVLDGRPDYRLRLDNLTTLGGDDLTPETHADCPGHVAWLGQEWVNTTNADDDGDGDGDGDGDSVDAANDGAGDTDDDNDTEAEDDESDDDDGDDGWRQDWVAVYGCADPVTHGHRSRFGRTPHPTTSGNGGGSGNDADGAAGDAAVQAVKDAEREQRRMVLANNKAWRQADSIRRDWLTTLAARKTPPKGSTAFLTVALTRDTGVLQRAATGTTMLASALLDLEDLTAVTDAAETASDARAGVIALLTVLAAYEDATRVDSWRTPTSADRRYFAWLAANGYPLSDVETLVTTSHR